VLILKIGQAGLTELLHAALGDQYLTGRKGAPAAVDDLRNLSTHKLVWEVVLSSHFAVPLAMDQTLAEQRGDL